MLRFYKGSITPDAIRKMRPEQFGMYVDEMNLIAKLEQGQEQPAQDVKAAAMADPAVRVT